MVEPLDDGDHDIGQGPPRRRKRKRRRRAPESAPVDEDEPGPVAMFFTGAFFLVCGILMLLNWIGGKTEVDGGGIFAFVLGDSLFALLAMAICLFIGVAGVIAPFMGENDQARAARERRERALERAAERRASGRARRPERRSASGSILLECPHCGASSRIPAKYAGKKGRCPRCDSGVRAPELE